MTAPAAESVLKLRDAQQEVPTEVVEYVAEQLGIEDASLG